MGLITEKYPIVKFDSNVSAKLLAKESDVLFSDKTMYINFRSVF
jgi:hypothetical protein